MEWLNQIRVESEPGKGATFYFKFGEQLTISGLTPQINHPYVV